MHRAPDCGTRRPTGCDSAGPPAAGHHGPATGGRSGRATLLIASHDLRLPVTVIKTQAQLLQRDIRRDLANLDALDAGLVTIVGQADRLAKLLSLLFDLSQIEAGRLEIMPAPMDLRLLASTTIAGIQVTTERHQLMLRAPPEVAGCWDERRLQQVIGNLVTNAVKYSPNGGRITLSIRAGMRSVTARLRDHGMGLGADEALHVFERFYRAEGIRQLEGTGLGLYIAQGIVTAHGGRIWAESVGPGQGSAFCFTLLAAELYAHHSAGLDDDDSAELRDQVADPRLQPGQGLPPLASKPRLGGVLHSLRSLRPCG
jgi:signal transduction histidine kinase